MVINMNKTIKLSLFLILAVITLCKQAFAESEILISDSFTSAVKKLGYNAEVVRRLCQPLPDISRIECRHSGDGGPFEQLVVVYGYNDEVTEKDMYHHTNLNEIHVDLKNRNIKFWSGHIIVTPEQVGVTRIKGSSDAYIDNGTNKREFITLLHVERKFERFRETTYHLLNSYEFNYQSNQDDAVEALARYNKVVSDNDYVIAYKEGGVIEPVQIMKGASFTFPMSDQLRQRLIDVVKRK